MGVLVLYIELVGTMLGCWFWEPQPFGILRTTNPPVGAFVCYVIADILLIKIAARLAPLIARWRPTGNAEVMAPGYTTVNRRSNDIG